MDAIIKVLVCATCLTFWGMGIHGKEQVRANEQCPPSGIIRTKAVLANGTVRDYVHNGTIYDRCNCTQTNGSIWTAPDGTDCMVTTLGYDGEPTKKFGKCLDGQCVYIKIPRGCDRPGQKKQPQENELVVGCAFTCYGELGNKEFDYYNINTTCLHYLNATHNVTTTCKQVGLEILCREEGSLDLC